MTSEKDYKWDLGETGTAERAGAACCLDISGATQ